MTAESTALEQLAQARTHENQLRFVVTVGLRRWPLIAGFAVLFMLLFAIGGAMLRKEMPRYQAMTTLIINQSPWEKDLLQGLGARSFVPLDPKTVVKRANVQKTSFAQETARALIQQDIEQGAGWSDAATPLEIEQRGAEIERLVAVEEIPDAGMISVRAQADSAEQAARIADVFARVLIEQMRQSQVEEGKEAHELVKQQLTSVRENLEQAENEEWDYRKQLGFRTHTQVAEDMDKIHNELLETVTESQEIEARLKEIQAELAANSEELPKALGNVTDSVVDNLLEELDELLEEHLSMSQIYTPEYPDLQMLEEDIAEKKRAILDAVDKIDATAAGGSTIWGKRQELYRQQMQLRLDQTAQEIREVTLRKVLQNMEENLPELASKSREYERLTHETERRRTEFNKLVEAEFDIRNTLARRTGFIERHSPAQASVIPTGQRHVAIWVNALIGCFVGFLVGFGLSLMLEMMNTAVRDIEDIPQYIGLEVIGTIPRMRFGKVKPPRHRRGAYVSVANEEQIDACIVTQHDPKSPISEAYRTLRTNFQFATIREKPKTLMITSSTPGEGKTTTAVNMAVTMADRGIRVLLVDTDLRRPNVHRVLKMERGAGLADVLRDEARLEDVIRPTRIENLWIISSGRVPPNPSELIGSERMSKLMERLGNEFDFVVCDAPSVLVVTDPVLLATHTDCVALVVAMNWARRETIIRARKHLETANARVAGVILNGLEATRRHYYYYYYYYEDAPGRRRRRWYHF